MITEPILPVKGKKPIYKAIESLVGWNLCVDVFGYGTLVCLIGNILLIYTSSSAQLYRTELPIVHFLLNTLHMTLMVLMMCGFLFVSISIPITFLLNIVLLLWVSIRIVRLGSLSRFIADLPWKRRQLTVGIIGTLLFYIGVALFIWTLATWNTAMVDFPD